jgi:outer membrane usher protein
MAVDKLADSASLRYGLTERLTLEGHSEATSGRANGGLGAIVALDGVGLISAAMSGSWQGGSGGVQVYGAFETAAWGMSFSASTESHPEL